MSEPHDKRDAVLKRLRDLPSWGNGVDPEDAHKRADEALLDLISDPEITEAFEAVHKWYS